MKKFLLLLLLATYSIAFAGPLDPPPRPQQPYSQRINDLYGVPGPGDGDALGFRMGINQRALSSYFLKNWAAKVSKIQNALAGTHATIVWLGDSWLNGGMPALVRQPLQRVYSNAGPGFQTLYYLTSVNTGVSMSVTGSWVAARNGAANIGTSISDVTSTDTATPAKISMSATGTDWVIEYYNKPNGGSFRWRTDAGAWTTVATANATLSVQRVTIPTLSNAFHLLEIEVTVAGSAGVTLSGVDIRQSGAGVILHNIGSGGADTAAWARAANQTVRRANLTALSPDVVMVTLGTNDGLNGVSAATVKSNLQTIISDIQAVNPLADIVFVTPSNVDTVATSLTDAYDFAQRQLAADFGAAYVSGPSLIGSYTDGNARGLFVDSAHLNAYGWQIISASVLDLFRQRAWQSPVEGRPNGNVGLGWGATDPGAVFGVLGEAVIANSLTPGDLIRIRGGSAAPAGAADINAPRIRFGGGFTFQTFSQEDILTLRGDTKRVGIKNWNPAHELDVTGDIRATGSLTSTLAVHADNAAAVTAGLPVGRFYRTATGEVRVVIP